VLQNLYFFCFVCVCVGNSFDKPKSTGGLSFSRLTTLSLLIISCFAWYVFASCPAHTHVVRLNYGFVAKCVKPIKLISGYWHHTFHIPLPPLRQPVLMNTTRSCSRINPGLARQTCKRVAMLHRVLANLTYSLQESVAETVQQIYTMVPDVNPT